MKIMIALDDSPHSARAVEFVTRMKWPAGSRVIVATVMRPAERTATRAQDEADLAPGELVTEQRLHHEAIITRAQSTLREAGLPTERRIAEGNPREQLLRLVQDERADLLVLGSRGCTGLAQFMLRSVSSHAVNHAGCSVMVVKQTAAAVGSRRE
jgi:nucleotide-binding universal stress UspA family protein